MSKVIKYLPEIEGEEQLFVAGLMTDMSHEQAEQFAHVYRQRRRDSGITLGTALLGLIVVAGVHRFYLGQIGMGVLYLLTGGLCLIGTIVDLFNHKDLTYRYNRERAIEVATLIRGAFPTPPAQLSE